MSECILSDCENGILHEYDCNDSFGNHTTGVIYCPMCHPEQYEPDSDPLIAAAPEMLELIQQVADLQNPRNYGAAYNDLVMEQDRLADLAQELLAKIEGGGE